MSENLINILNIAVTIVVAIATVTVLETWRSRYQAKRRLQNSLQLFQRFTFPDRRSRQRVADELRELDIPESRADEILAVSYATTIRSWLASAQELEKEAGLHLSPAQAQELMSCLSVAHAISTAYEKYSAVAAVSPVGSPEYNGAVAELTRTTSAIDAKRYARIVALCAPGDSARG